MKPTPRPDASKSDENKLRNLVLKLEQENILLRLRIGGMIQKMAMIGDECTNFAENEDRVKN